MKKINFNSRQIIQLINSFLIWLIILLTTVSKSIFSSIVSFNFNILLFIVIFIFILINLKIEKIYILPLIIVLSSIIGSTLVNSNTLDAAGQNAAIFTVLAYCFFAIPAKDINFYLLNNLLLIFMAISLLLTFYIQLTGISWLFEESIDNINYLGFRGLVSFFENRNSAGMFFYSSSIICLYFLKGFFVSKIFFLTYFLLTFFSLSRTSMVALVVFTVAYYGVIYKKISRKIIKKPFYVIFFACLCLMIIFFAFSYFFSSEIQTIIQRFQNIGTGSGRTEIWSQILNNSTSTIKNIIFGIGPNRTRIVVNGKELTTHNAYLNEFSNLGLFYLISAMTFLWITYYDAVKQKCYKYPPVLAATLILGLTETEILGAPTIVWMILPIVLKLEKIKSSDKNMITSRVKNYR